MTTSGTSQSLEEIGEPWLSDCLSIALGTDVKVRSFICEPIGAGNLSHTVRIKLSYVDDAGGGPASLICKMHARTPEAHAFALATRAYDREAHAYDEISRRSGCNLPKCYFISGDEQSIILLMEDLTRSTRSKSQVEGCTEPEARAVARQLACLHAAFFPLPADLPPTLLPNAADNLFWEQATLSGSVAALARFATHLSKSQADVIKQAAQLAPAWYGWQQGNLTLAHGDARLDNILFRTADPSDAVVLDWQMAGARNRMYDLAYFLSGSVDTALRRDKEHLIIAEYEAAFGSTIANSGSDAMLVEYAVNLASGIMTTLAAVNAVADEPASNAMLMALLDRNIAAVTDWQSLALIPGGVKKSVLSMCPKHSHPPIC